MSPAAFFYGILTAVLVISISASCPRYVSCPCGISNKNYTFCINDALNESSSCDRWAYCETCENNITHCATCPHSRTGPFCSKVESEKIRRKRQYYTSPEQNHPGQFGVCPHLESPDLGAISCTQSGNYRVCTGRCLPGYVFEDEVYSDEMTLECRGGYWRPRQYFPPCKSQGHCNLRVIGAGFFNCTTGMDGTRCDVNCDGVHQGRYHCYPGRGWNPPLPYCAVPKHGESNRRPCRCENGGICDDNGKCRCPRGRTGTYCEHFEREKASCPDPGIPRGGERMNSDGTDASYPRVFEEGESVIYSCSDENLALQGTSFITCRSDGTWSASRPQCIRSRGDSVVYCPDPGQIAFGIRRNAQGSFTGSTQRYSPGQSVIYSCRHGYELQGNRLITCLRTGEWSSKKPRCVRYRTAIGGTRGGEVSCSHPGVNENTEITGDNQDSQLDQEFPPGTELRYVCKEGYESEGAMTIYCLRTGEWTSVAPSCRSVTPSTTANPGPACRHPGVDINGLIEDHPLLDPRKRGQTFPPGTELKFYCREGFEPVGAVILYCLRSGEWSTAPPSCLAIPTTTAVSPAETRIQCTHPGVDPNAEVEIPPIDPRKVGPGFDAGEVLTYSCKDGYDMEGQASITCLRNGQWSDSAPRCNLRSRVADGSSNLAQCENLGPISNGRVVVFRTLDERRQPSTSDQEDFEYPAGTRLQYSCEEGFAVRGESNLVCETTGFWSAEAPLCIEDCGRSRLQTTRRITHGTKTVAGEWPWTVAIAVTSRNSNSTYMVCGGALLDRRTVLTAAHCLTDSEHFTLYLGKFHRLDRLDDRLVETRISSQLISHPEFDSVTYDNDIAMVKFVPDVRYTERIQPICLPTPRSTQTNLAPGQRGYVTGWGLTELQLPSDELLMAHLPVQSNQLCVEAYAKMNISLNLSNGMFCAGFPTGRTSTCRGDSGSPMVFYDRDTDQHTVEGLVSFGINGQCDLPDRYTVFTRVAHFMPWILRNWPR